MGLFKRLLNPRSNLSSKNDGASKYVPKEKLPLDEKFTYYFKQNGGKFLYCITPQEILEAFDNILLENDWYEQDVFCIDPDLTARFDGFNLNFDKKSSSKFFLSKCESLVANDGAILFSSNQIKEKEMHELPANLVIFATTSQFVENISEGMRIIKNKSKERIPTNITTIKDFEVESDKEKDFMTYGSSTKNLYLLLLEDL
jgi:L-lactate utilization protein LutC